jgi:hypothetical protein
MDGVLTKAISQNDFEDFMKREIAKYSKLLKTIEVKND